MSAGSQSFTPEQVVAHFMDLNEPDKEKVQNLVGGLPRPPTGVASAIWIMIIAALVVLVLGGAIGIYLMETHTPIQDSKIVVGMVTTALGALIGLIAPSPVTQSGK